MFNWSEKFETHIEIIDTQHKKLVAILDKLCVAINRRNLDEESLNNVLIELANYAKQHFADEEQLMHEYHVSEKHISLHCMEHRSFAYDVEKVRKYISPNTDIFEIGEKLVQFITSWLTYHILGLDKLMVAQIHDIKLGFDPEKAYHLHTKATYDIDTTRLLLDSVLKMWKQSTDHTEFLEDQLHQCLIEKNSPPLGK